MSSAHGPLRSQWYLAALVLLFGAGSALALADSLILPSPAQIAGPWQISAEASPQAQCAFRLRQSDRAVLDPQHCLSSILGFVALSWSVQPDGIVLHGAGETLPMLFSRQDAARYSGRDRAGKTVWIERRDH